ncbi:COX15/CtaA family protein [Pelagibacteraceae bacterium]|nr:COX15/CtaA family protein [Pelagibacteraceae bacterium]
MTRYDKNINKLFLYWLILSLVLIFFIIIVGGLTRLTNSGLSITEWELFTGILPPLNQETWEVYFNEYKKIPQYKILNPQMSLNEFKIIFYWEYFHRLIARIIGLFFLIPLLFFYFSRSIKKNYISICFKIFLLIVLQGAIGWYMVRSGLVNDVTVSHYRLSLHLGIAILIIASIFWIILNTLRNTNLIFFEFRKRNIPFLFLMLLIFLQIILGAFVSGLDAGQIYQTWPLMGYTYFPNDLIFSNKSDVLDFNNHSLVQFYHRNLAYFITFYIVALVIYIYNKRLLNLYSPMKLVIIFLLIQIILGIFTLLSGLNIFLSSAHQITSVILVFSAINLYYFQAK